MRSDACQLLNTLRGMIRRCSVPTATGYIYYGGRGIRVCGEWVASPARFIAWAMANGYENGLEIDRIDNDKDYEPENCRWVTRAVNHQRRRHHRKLQRNRVLKHGKTSQFMGVYRYIDGRITASIQVNGKRLRLGNFRDESEAARAYDRAVVQYGRDRIYLNFPEEHKTAIGA